MPRETRFGREPGGQRPGRRRRRGARLAAPEVLEGRTLLNAQLLKDINPIDATPTHLTAVGADAFFFAHSPDGAVELWATDGHTAAKAAEVSGANDGGGDSPLLGVGGFAYYRGQHRGATAGHLMRSDGTAPGTIDLSAALGDAQDPDFLGMAGGLLYFTEFGDQGVTVKATDGTVAGTRTVAEVPAPSPSDVNHGTASGSSLDFLVGSDSTPPALWHSDGTAGGAAAVTNLSPGHDMSEPGSLADLGGTLYFINSNPDHQTAGLWKTDPTGAGATWIADIPDGRAGALADSPVELFPAGDRLFLLFNAMGRAGEILVSDGTAAGTSIVADVIPDGSDLSLGPALGTAGGGLFFNLIGSSGTQLWASDATAQGTARLADLRTGASAQFAVVGSTLFFTNDDGSHGVELWTSDGTATGTAMVADLNPGPQSALPQDPTNVDGTLYFVAHDGSGANQVWRSDGTAAGTSLVQAFAPGQTLGGSGAALGALGGAIYFSADDGVHGSELWRTNGTGPSTMLVKDLVPGPVGARLGGWTVLDGVAYFKSQARSGGGTTLWRTDGTAGGTRPVARFPDDADVDSDMIDFKGQLYFVVEDANQNRTLWASDGTAQGTRLVDDLAPGGAILADLSDLTVFNGLLYFAATGPSGDELYRSAGQPGDAVLVADIRSGGSSNPRDLTVFNGDLYFAASGPDGDELWRLSGTTGAVAQVADINPGTTDGLPGSSYPSDLTVLGSYLLFNASDPQGGSELWRTDGTTTARVADIDPSPAGSNPLQLTVVGSLVYFTAFDPSIGDELWRTDGVAVAPVGDLNAGSGSPGISDMTALDGTLYFGATASDALGYELYKVDPHTGGIVLAADLNPGPGSSFPLIFGRTGGGLVVSADDGIHGREPMALVGAVAGDDNGDGSADLAAFRPSTAQWFERLSGPPGPDLRLQFGGAGFVPVAGDFDGDGKADLAVFNPSNAVWYVQQSSLLSKGSAVALRVQRFGSLGSIPVPGDFDGDGKADLAVFDPSSAVWYIQQSATGTLRAQQFGPGGATPVPADYDGDHRVDLAVFSPANGVWYIEQSSLLAQGPAAALRAQNFGGGTDVPVPADYDGDGKADLAVFRTSDGHWYQLRSTAGFIQSLFAGGGSEPDIPVVSPIAWRVAAATDAVRLDTTGANPAAAPSTANPYIDNNFGHQIWLDLNTRFTTEARNPVVQTVLLGDSITAYFAGAPAIETLGAFRPVDFGIPGDRTQNILWRVENGDLSGHAPVVVLLAGINNLYSGDTPEQTAGGIAAIIEAIHRQSPDTQVLLLGLLPSMQSATDPIRARIRRTNDLIQRLGRLPYVTFEDFGSQFLAPDGSLRLDLMPDQTHPSAQGYALFADELRDPLTRLLSRRAVPGAVSAATLRRRGVAARA